jgi:tetratricopeptide (TPR) repeat protein
MVRLVISSILAVFCSAAVPQAGAPGKLNAPAGRSPLQVSYDQALRLQKEGNLDQAAKQYRTFLTTALGELANSQAQLGAYAKASALFDEALTLTPGSLSVRGDYATAALQAGDLKRAETLSRALLSDSANTSAELVQSHRILGQTLHRMNRDQDAKKELEAAAALDPSFQNEYDLAVVCLDLDDEKCAVQIFDHIEASVEDSPALHMQIGRAYGNSDYTPRAVTEFKKVLAKDPHYPGAHYCVAAALLAAGEDEKTLQEAEAELKEELLVSPKDFLTYAALGKIEASYHRYPQAEQYLKHAILLNPRNPDAFLYLGQMYFDTKRLAEAEPNLRRAIELTRDVSRNHYQIQKAHFLLGRILIQNHHEDEAHKEMRIAHVFTDKALSKDKSKLAGMLSDGPTSPTSSDRVATDAATESATRPHAADPVAVTRQRAFEKQLTPAIADSYNNLGAIMASETNYTDALKYFQRAASWIPSLEGLDLNIGHAAFTAAKFSEAIPPLSRYLRSHPADSGIRGALAMSQFMTDNYRGCIDALKGAGTEVMSIPQMQYIYAESLVKTGEVKLGKARLESLETTHPEIAEVHRSLGEILELQGNKKATGELRNAIQLNANDPESHYDLGRIELEIGDTSTAIPELESAIRFGPNEPKYHKELADAYKLALRPADAEKELQIYGALHTSQEQPAITGAGSTKPKPE